MTLRDLLVIGGAALSEPGSLRAFWSLAKCAPRALRERREIMRRRRVDDAEVAEWFSFKPVSQAVGEITRAARWADSEPRYTAERTA
jgi:hypothetical protein